MNETEKCAAGPWRYDVENAPKDGVDVLLAWGNGIGGVACGLLHWCADSMLWRDDSSGYLSPVAPFAFAEINPPESTP